MREFRKVQLPENLSANQDIVQETVQPQTSPTSPCTAIIGGFIGIINGARLQYVFNKFCIQFTAAFLTEISLLQKLEHMWHFHFEQANLDAVMPTAYALSVGLYLIRFTNTVVEAIIMARGQNSWNEFFIQFGQELYNRQILLLNDSVWCVINGITNYSAFFHIAPVISDLIVGTFLIFDIWVATHNRRLALHKFRQEKQIINQELTALQQAIMYEYTVNRQELTVAYFAKKAELDKLQREWDGKNGGYWFLVAGTAVLFSGFAAAMMLALFASTPASLFVCIIGVAMIGSNKAYSDYHCAMVEARDNPSAVNDAELVVKRRDFILTFTYNFVTPIVIITTLAICWPAAVALGGLYFAYEFGKWIASMQKPQPEIVNVTPDAPLLAGALPDTIGFS